MLQRSLFVEVTMELPPIELDDGLPFWAGGLLLGLVSVAFALATRRPLGGSGAVACAFSQRSWRDERARRAMDEDEAALREATLAMFGSDAVDQAGAAAPLPSTSLAASAPPLGWTPSAIFVVCLVLGGVLSHVLPGGPTTSGPWVSWLGSGAAALAVLFVGGAFVGFGTQLAGGCTTGHGLTGTPRFQPGSLLATAAFFGTGIVVSFVLHALFGTTTGGTP
jgi:uncharacterized membrane protein YedE/YeeE